MKRILKVYSYRRLDVDCTSHKDGATYCESIKSEEKCHVRTSECLKFSIGEIDLKFNQKLNKILDKLQMLAI